MGKASNMWGRQVKMKEVIIQYANTNLCDFRISGSRKNNFDK